MTLTELRREPMFPAPAVVVASHVGNVRGITMLALPLSQHLFPVSHSTSNV